MRHPSWRGIGTALICAMSLCMALAAPAGADEYPSGSARTFNGGTNGWTSSSSFDGTCIPPLLCPRASNEYVAAGDANGNGYITSDYLGVAGVAAVAGTTTAVWESPAFTYADSDGISFSMSRRADVGQLLAISGNSADYAVQLKNVSEGGRLINVIAQTTMAGADSWTNVPAVSVKASRLTPGDDYRIRIESIYKTGTSVVADGSADYDNVALSTTGSGNGGNGNGKGKGRNGKGDGNGNGGLTSSELRSLYSSGLASSVALPNGGKGKKLFVKVSCPKKIGRACRVTAQGLLRKRKPATSKRTVRVAKGKSRRVALRVKPKLRSKVKKRKRLLVKEKVKVGKTSATAFKVRKLIRR